MPDILIRDVSEAAVAVIDSNAARLGLSRNEYLRKRLAEEVPRSDEGLTAEKLEAFTECFSDAADEEVMRNAWR